MAPKWPGRVKWLNSPRCGGRCTSASFSKVCFWERSHIPYQSAHLKIIFLFPRWDIFPGGFPFFNLFGLCKSWWANEQWRTIFPILNDVQRAATRWRWFATTSDDVNLGSINLPVRFINQSIHDAILDDIDDISDISYIHQPVWFINLWLSKFGAKFPSKSVSTIARSLQCDGEQKSPKRTPFSSLNDWWYSMKTALSSSIFIPDFI